MKRAPFVGGTFVGMPNRLIIRERAGMERYVEDLNGRAPYRAFRSHALRLAYAALERRRARGAS